MFNKTYFQYTLLVPPVVATAQTTQDPVCVVKSTANTNSPVPVPAGSTESVDGRPPIIEPGNTITIYSAPTNLYVQFQGYNSVIYIESYNFVKVMNGQANVVFST
jgi:hypothetical protein